MSTITVINIALGCLLVAVVLWRMFMQQGFQSRKHYWARNIGVIVMLSGAGAEVAATQLQLGVNLVIAACIGAVAGLGLLFWGNAGLVRPGP